MASITHKQRIALYIFGFVLLIPNIIVIIGLSYNSLKYGNFTETITNAKEPTTLLTSTLSFLISFAALVIINSSLEITEKTLKLTEIEQQKRDIEQRVPLQKIWLPCKIRKNLHN